MKTIVERTELQEEDTWKLEDLFLTDSEWEETYKKYYEKSEQMLQWKGKVTDSLENFSAFMALYCEMSPAIERLYVYAHEKYHQDTTNATYQALSEKATALAVRFSASVAYFEPEVLAMEDEAFDTLQKKWLELSKPAQEEAYIRFFGEIRRGKAHRLSTELEELLVQAKEPLTNANTVFSMFNNADLTFSPVVLENGEKLELTHGNFSTLIKHKERSVRKQAFESMHRAYGKFENTLAAMYSTNVKTDIFYSKVRKYKSSLAQALDKSHIPEQVYENLISVVHENLSQLHRYMKIRKNALGVDTLHLYDVYVPMVDTAEKKVTFSEAKDIVKEGLKPLGEEYAQILDEGFRNRWIDIYENKGKRSGAYSWGCYGVHPYVLLNYQEDWNSVFTLAHEMGHALHSYFSNRTQAYVTADYEIFVAEVASTCNEALLIHYLLENTKDKKQRAYFINYQLEQFRTTLFRQTMFAEFEWKAHSLAESGEALTAAKLKEIYFELNQLYFGKDTEIDEEIAMEWARIPHFYTSYYVYQYATGYAAAIALSARILKEGKKAIDDYIGGFLCGGGSKDPIDLLKIAGVDMGQPSAVQASLDVFKNLLDQIEEIL